MPSSCVFKTRGLRAESEPGFIRGFLPAEPGSLVSRNSCRLSLEQERSHADCSSGVPSAPARGPARRSPSHGRGLRSLTGVGVGGGIAVMEAGQGRAYEEVLKPFSLLARLRHFQKRGLEEEEEEESPWRDPACSRTRRPLFPASRERTRSARFRSTRCWRLRVLLATGPRAPDFLLLVTRTSRICRLSRSPCPVQPCLWSRALPARLCPVTGGSWPRTLPPVLPTPASGTSALYPSLA